MKSNDDAKDLGKDEWDFEHAELIKPEQSLRTASVREDAEVRATAEARSTLFALVTQALDHAYAKHGRALWGRHEFYAILKEEVDEIWDAIKDDEPQERVIAELVQIAAVCMRYYETGDRYRQT